MIRAFAVALTLLGALWGCNKSESPPPAPQAENKPAESAPATPAATDTKPAAQPAAAAGGAATVKIGVAVPLTGPQSHFGKDISNGVQLALEEANAEGITIGGNKITFEMVAEDDQADPKTGTVVAQKLVDAKVAGVVGHMNSGTSIPASKIYSEAGIPQITPSATNPMLTNQGFKTTFRTMGNDVLQGKALGDFIAKELQSKSVIIVDDRTAYGQGLADEVEKAVKAGGGNILAREYTNDKATDFKSILTAAKAKKPEALFYGGMDAQGAPMAKQFKELGLAGKFVGGDGLQSPKFIELAGSSAEGAYGSSPGLPLDKMPGGAGFADKFKAKFSEGIQLYAPYAYDAAKVMIAAMKKADSADPAKYLGELAKISIDGVTGKIEFDAKGDLKGAPVTVYEVKGGKWEALKTLAGS